MFKNKNILIIGDVMLDSYLFGEVSRISPEAPVPIVNIKSKDYKLGGAANVATNIKNLGGNPIICTIIGNDTNSNIFLSELKVHKIDETYIIKSDSRKTTEKLRIIGNNHQMLRVDDEITSNISKKEEKILIINILQLLKVDKIDCIIYQDYDKGIITENLIKIITRKANSLKIPIIVDPKNRNFHLYKNTTLIKPNLKEFKDIISIDNDDKDILYKGTDELHKMNIDIIFVTLSEKGIFISYKNEDKIIKKHIKGIPINVSDVSGAGDTCISVISLLINDLDISEIAFISNLAGSLVCEEIGVVPINKEKLIYEYSKLSKTKKS